MEAERHRADSLAPRTGEMLDGHADHGLGRDRLHEAVVDRTMSAKRTFPYLAAAAVLASALAATPARAD